MTIQQQTQPSLTILETYASELAEKAELVRTLGKQLIALAPQGESRYPVEWIVRISGDHNSLIGIELTLRDQCLLSISVWDIQQRGCRTVPRDMDVPF